MSGWECFDDDASSDTSNEISNDDDPQSSFSDPSERSNELPMIFVAVLQELGVPRRETQLGSHGPVELSIVPRVCIFDDNALEDRFRSANFEVISKGTLDYFVDCLIATKLTDDIGACQSLLCPGGILAVIVDSPSSLLPDVPASSATVPDPADAKASAAVLAATLVDPRHFQVEEARTVPLLASHLLLLVRRRGVSINEQGVSWKPRSSRLLAQERSLVESLTVCRPTSCLRAGTLGSKEVEQCAQALRVHGVCVVPRLFSSEAVRACGLIAIEDLKHAVTILESAGIGGSSGEGDGGGAGGAGAAGGEKSSGGVCDKARRVLGGEHGLGAHNYHELAMRESLRVDLRHGPRMVKFNSNLPNTPLKASSSSFSSEQPGVEAAPKPPSPPEIPPALGLNPRHCGLLEVLDRLMNPQPTPPESEASSSSSFSRRAEGADARPHSHGNFGRWNFEGGSPTREVPLAVRELGAVISLPGCADQVPHFACCSFLV